MTIVSAVTFGAVLSTTLLAGGNIGSLTPRPAAPPVLAAPVLGFDGIRLLEDEETGACIYPKGLTSACTAGVTKKWCDDKRGSWSARQKCPDK